MARKKCWEALKALLMLVPPGYVTTYGTLAKYLGVSPRAVGRMLASNEELVKVPCHRVVKSDGSLGGYRLGVEFKRKLLELEGVEFCGPRVCERNILRSLL